MHTSKCDVVSRFRGREGQQRERKDFSFKEYQNVRLFKRNFPSTLSNSFRRTVLNYFSRHLLFLGIFSSEVSYLRKIVRGRFKKLRPVWNDRGLTKREQTEQVGIIIGFKKLNSNFNTFFYMKIQPSDSCQFTRAISLFWAYRTVRRK